MAIREADSHEGATFLDVAVQTDRLQIIGEGPEGLYTRLLLVGRRPGTRRARLIALDYLRESGALAFRDNMETGFPTLSAAVTTLKNTGDFPSAFLVLVREDRRVVIQGINVAASGQLSGFFTQETEFLADEVSVYTNGTFHWIVMRQGTNVALTSWRVNFSAAQATGASLLVPGVGGIGLLSGALSDTLHWSPLEGGSGFRLKSLLAAGGDLQPMGDALSTGDDVAISFGVGIMEGSPTDDFARTAAVATISPGPTEVRTGLFGLAGRLLIGGGTLSLGLWQVDSPNFFDAGPFRQEAQADLEGWYAIAHEAVVTALSDPTRILTAHLGHTTWQRPLQSDQGKPVVRLIQWEVAVGGGRSVIGLSRVADLDLGGQFREISVMSPALADDVQGGDGAVLVMLDGDDRLSVRSLIIDR